MDIKLLILIRQLYSNAQKLLNILILCVNALEKHYPFLLNQVSVKATTNERLGSFGRGEGCAAYAIASIVSAGRM